MLGIKITPPERLPSDGLTEQLFKIYRTDLEVYLPNESRFDVFMEDGDYLVLESFEANKNRITMAMIKQPDTSAEHLKVRTKELKTFLSLVAKTVSVNH
jgi:hypothetical protein